MTGSPQNLRAEWRRQPWMLASLLIGAATVGACSSASAPSFGADGSFESGTGGSSQGVGDDGASVDGLGSGSGGEAPLPPEVEDPGTFRAPVVTGSYLWSPNPESGRVALIDARDSSVRLLSAGLRPTHVFAVPSEAEAPEAIVQNVGSADASYLKLVDSEVVERRIATPAQVNQWTVSASGRIALASSTPEPGQMLDPTEGLQEVLVTRLDDPSALPVRLTVGYRPRIVVISDDEERAVVISEDGLNLISLKEPVELTRWVSLGVQGGLDASVTADARFALVRRPDSDQIEIIPLDSPEDALTIQMSSAVTDLDLGPAGLVVAVARSAGEVATFSMQDFDGSVPEVHRKQVDGLTVGSAVITEGGERVVLYTTAIPEERVAVLELLPGEDFLDYRTVSTKLAVKAVATSPNGRYAVILGQGASETKGGFSLVPLDQERFPRIVGTGAPVEAVALSDTGLLVTAANATVFEAHVGRLPELSVEKFTLASRPLSAGMVGEMDTGFVAQSHPEGRVTFFALRGDEVRTVSGYELSAEVIDE